MNDETLQQLLKDADARYQAAGQSATTTDSGMSMVVTIRRRRAQQMRRRTGLGVAAVLIIAGCLSTWTLTARPWNSAERASSTIASNSTIQPDGVGSKTTTNEPASTTGGASRRLQPEEIKHLQAEIAAIDAEANRARRLVDLYRDAEARRNRLAALEAAPAEPLLPPEALAELAIDRAAAITVASADAQANQFNRPAEAAESYRSVLTHFPSSRWAGVARQRLEAMEVMN